ncbi:MAG: PQQ-binding-like beta-propeller repeat protein [Candidatus Bathyarchaeota archaeon]|nr:PQQ-binding-like beta-propeller repeat protein [Candidatus Bathyarchaeota archaeon]
MRLINRIVAGFLVISLVFCAQIIFVDASSVDNWPVSRHDSSQTGFSTSVAPTSEVLQLWNYTIDADTISAPQSPVVVEGRVYIGSRDYGVCCLDATDGTKIWNFVTSANFDSSLAVVNGLVYAASDDGNIYCLDASNGNQIWDISVGASINSPVNFADGRLYVVSTAGELYCLDGSSGEQLWNFSTVSKSVRKSPAISDDGYVFFTNTNGDVFCINSVSGSLVWNVSIGSSVGSPVVVDDFLYFGSKDGNAYCLDVATGVKVWNYTTWYNNAGPSHGYHWGNSVSDPAVAYGCVYVGSSDFDVFCLDAFSGEKLWNFSTGGIVHAPSVADGCVFAGSYDGNLYCLNASSGAKIWQNLVGVFSPVSMSGSAGSPAISDGVVYVVGNGVLSAWGLPSSDDLSFPLLEFIIVAILAIIATVTIAYLYFKRK